MNNSGYTLIEPEIIGEWLGTTSNQGMLVALLQWLVTHIKAESAEEFSSSRIEVEVLKVEYLGVYPTIGVHDDGNLSKEIVSKIEGIIVEKIKATPIVEFLQFALNSDRDWNSEAERLLHA